MGEDIEDILCGEELTGGEIASDTRLRIEKINKRKKDIKKESRYSKLYGFFTCFYSAFTLLATHGLYDNRRTEIIRTLLFAFSAVFIALEWSRTKSTIRGEKRLLGLEQKELLREEIERRAMQKYQETLEAEKANNK